MVIHVVKAGESLYSISRRYGIAVEKIAADNELNVSQSLVAGQTIVVMVGTRQHTVRAGESLDALARQYGTTVSAIQAANRITDASAVNPGAVITIPSGEGKLGTIEVNGYAFPTIRMDVLRKTLPYLTYLSIFSYEVNTDGSIGTLKDEEMIRETRAAKVAPIMVISNIRDNGFNSDLAKMILTSESVQDTLITNIINNLRVKNYAGLDVDFEYVYPENREDYNSFLKKLNGQLKPLGYSLTTAVAPKTSAGQKGVRYEAHDYRTQGALADNVILMTYDNGHAYGPPAPVAPINEVRKVLQYSVSAISRQFIFMGIPNYGYDWTIPYNEGSKALAVSNTGAVNLARREGAGIKYDQKAQAPFFNYTDAKGKEHIVWFDDARSIEAKLRLLNQYTQGGASFWTVGQFFPQNWLIVSSLYDVRKII